VKPAYHVAITTLKKLPFFHTPSRKVTCLVNTANAIIEAVRLHYRDCKDDQDIAVSADDLLPIFTYVMIKAIVPNLCSEVALVCDFLSDAEARSMEGYTIVTIQTCISFIGCLEESELSQNAAQLFEKITLEQKLRGSQEIDNVNNTVCASDHLLLEDLTIINGDMDKLLLTNSATGAEDPTNNASISLITWDSSNP